MAKIFIVTVFLVCLQIVRGSLFDARNVTVLTQTNISSQSLIDPSLTLPFTSFLYVSQGTNTTEYPPTTARIAQRKIRIAPQNDVNLL